MNTEIVWGCGGQKVSGILLHTFPHDVIRTGEYKLKRRIEQLLNGIFEYERPALVFTPETLLVEVVKDGIWHGSFRIESEDHRKVKGFLYTSSPRVICDPVEFQGMENEIHCQIDCSGLEEGATEQGTIAVCSDLGEYTIPYTIEVKRQSRETESPFFTELAGFAKLAREDFQRAYRDFISPGFRNTIEKREPSLLDCMTVFGFRR